MSKTGQEPPDSGEYDFAPAPTKPRNAPPSPPPTLGYRSTKTETPASSREPVDPQGIISQYVPWMLCGAVLVEVGAAYFTKRNFRDAVITLGISLLLGTAVKVLAILLLGRLRQIDFGPFPMAVLKLATASVVPNAVFTLIYPLLMYIPLGGLLGLAGEFILFFALLGALFNLDEQDTWSCVIVFFLMDLAVYVLWSWMAK